MKILVPRPVSFSNAASRYSLGEDTIGDSADGDNSEVEVDIGSWTTVLVEAEIGLPSSCSMIAPRISVSSFLNSASSTAFPSLAFAILNASFTTVSTCSTAP
uniref:Uncharacterized protein n=1 Tax=Arundo donax TaxID=35708 RepID=A0A0A9GRH2_ARUDO